MHEISENVFIETSYPGVTLGAINWGHGLLLIDAPFRAEDVRAWRLAIANLSSGVDRMLVNLDAHYDRTLGARAMECMILGHEVMANAFRNRSVTFKAQNSETGAEWEGYNGLGSIRWAPPEITFSQTLQIQWDDHPLHLEHHPGPSNGAIWVELPVQKIVFVGDAVVAGQPPFLASANLPLWISLLKMLQTPAYQNHTLVSGRGGLVTHQDAHQLLNMLESLHETLEELSRRKGTAEDAAGLASSLIGLYPAETDKQNALFAQRLRWGLSNYFTRHYRSNGVEIED